MVNAMKTLLIGAIGALIVMAMLQFGVLEVRTPWADIEHPGDLTRHDDVLTPPAAPTITRIQPVSLDCRARVQTDVTVVGIREHALAGMVLRTDEVVAHVTGDVDTCVDGDLVEVTADGGRVTVSVPGEAIRYVRPRVDLTAPATHVTWDKGLLGEVTDLLPGVDDGDDLTVQALAYAQTVIGSSDCMGAALDVTTRMLVDAYTAQAVQQGVAADMVDVQVGTPDLGALETFEDLPQTTFDVSGPLRCALADGAAAGVHTDDGALIG